MTPRDHLALVWNCIVITSAIGTMIYAVRLYLHPEPMNLPFLGFVIAALLGQILRAHRQAADLTHCGDRP